MKKRWIAIVLVAVVLLAIAAYFLMNRQETPEFPWYSPNTYEQMQSHLWEAKNKFLLPGANVFDDFWFVQRDVYLDEPNGEPVGYILSVRQNPGDDHYIRTFQIECRISPNDQPEGEWIEEYLGVALYWSESGQLQFYANGGRYRIDYEITSELGGFQGEDMNREEAIKIAKNMIDNSKRE